MSNASKINELEAKLLAIKPLPKPANMSLDQKIKELEKDIALLIDQREQKQDWNKEGNRVMYEFRNDNLKRKIEKLRNEYVRTNHAKV